jgi:hypothetical protein
MMNNTGDRMMEMGETREASVSFSSLNQNLEGLAPLSFPSSSGGKPMMIIRIYDCSRS